jgi:hypothetical protein
MSGRADEYALRLFPPLAALRKTAIAINLGYLHAADLDPPLLRSSSEQGRGL